MNRLFWSLIIFEAIVVLGMAYLLILVPSRGGSNILDNVMGLVAAGLSVILVAASLAYWNTQSPGIRQFLLILVAAPLVVGASYGVILLRGAMNERHVTKYNDGRLVAFSRDATLSRFVLAVYELDARKVRELSQEVDINGVSLLGDYTPLKVAVERAVEA